MGGGKKIREVVIDIHAAPIVAVIGWALRYSIYILK
jgi:hypothetical protein